MLRCRNEGLRLGETTLCSGELPNDRVILSLIPSSSLHLLPNPLRQRDFKVVFDRQPRQRGDLRRVRLPIGVDKIPQCPRHSGQVRAIDWPNGLSRAAASVILGRALHHSAVRKGPVPNPGLTSCC